jgi:ABC-2 type transport system permease protein
LTDAAVQEPAAGGSRAAAAEPDPELRRIRGPSALGGGRRRFFELLWLLATTEFKTTYRGTALGYIWSLIRPLLLFGVLLLVFTQIVKLGNDVKNYAPLLLLNVMLFTFFSEATQAAVTSVSNKEQIVRKTQFPRLVIPLAVVLNAVFHLLLNLVVVMIFILAYGVDPIWDWLWIPVIVALLILITTAFAIGLSVLYVRFRDAAIIWSVVALVLFYGTPILYVIEMIDSEGLRLAIMTNPLAPLFEQARHWVIDPAAPSAVEAIGSWARMLAPISLFAAVCALGAWLFQREAPRVAENL